MTLLELAQGSSLSGGAIDLDQVMKLVGTAGGLAIVMIWIIATNCRKAAYTRQREETRRELSAYVAEGSIAADDAAKLIGADAGEQEERIKRAMADGWISPKKAEEMLTVARKARQA